MAPGLRLYRAENISRAAAFVLVVLSRFSPGLTGEAGRRSACSVTVM